MPDANGQLTDQDRLDLYNICQNSQNGPLNILSAAGFITGLAGENLKAIVQPFLEGIGQQGCDVFLTPAQLQQRAINQQQNAVQYGNQGPANLAANRHRTAQRESLEETSITSSDPDSENL